MSNKNGLCFDFVKSSSGPLDGLPNSGAGGWLCDGPIVEGPPALLLPLREQVRRPAPGRRRGVCRLVSPFWNSFRPRDYDTFLLAVEESPIWM